MFYVALLKRWPKTLNLTLGLRMQRKGSRCGDGGVYWGNANVKIDTRGDVNILLNVYTAQSQKRFTSCWYSEIFGIVSKQGNRSM